MTPVKQRVLFVDDEPHVLDGLRRLLHRLRNEWDMWFVASGEEAVKLMEAQAIDVVITDMRMPGMNGAQLLEIIRSRWPETIRLVLSGYSGKDLILCSASAAHRFLAKPCDLETIVNTVKRSCQLRDVLHDSTIQSMVSQIESLPVLPNVYSDLMDAISSERVPITQIGPIIARDISLSTKVLQIVNSPFFGLRRHIDDPSDAVVFLGLDTIRALVLSLGVFTVMDMELLKEFELEALEDHSMRVGTGARRISSRLRLSPPNQGYAFTAGLVHATGLLILMKSLSPDLRMVLDLAREGGRSMYEAEREILGTTHAHLGAYLLGLWGLPDPVVEAVLLHECPSDAPDRQLSPLTAVHIANVLDHQSHMDGWQKKPELDMEYLRALDLEDRVPDWIEMIRDGVDDMEFHPMGAQHGK